MNLHAWLFVGVIAVLFLRQALYTADDGVAILSGLASAGAWGLFAYQSLAVEIADGAGGFVTRRYPAVALFAVGLGVVGIFIALTGPIAAIGRETRQQTTQER